MHKGPKTDHNRSLCAKVR